VAFEQEFASRLPTHRLQTVELLIARLERELLVPRSWPTTRRDAVERTPSFRVHRKSRSQLPTAAIARGVEALDVERFVQELAGSR